MFADGIMLFLWKHFLYCIAALQIESKLKVCEDSVLVSVM